MNLPFEYDRVAVGEFGGTTPTTTDFEQRPRRHSSDSARSHDVVRAGHAQRPARDSRRLVAHGAVGRGNADRRAQHRHLHAAGDGVPVRDDGRGHARDPPRRVGARQRATSSRGPRRRALDYGARRRRRRGAAPRACPCCRSTRTPTCATRSWARRTTTRARCGGCSSTRRPRRSASAACRRRKRRRSPTLRTTIFYDYNMRQDPHWMDRVVDSLTDTVYITIDCDGLDPAIMPATGTPEPGGLSWYETLALLRKVIERANGRRLRPRRALADRAAMSRRTSSARSWFTRSCRTGSAREMRTR